jgi:hypothetical protein
MEILRLLCSCRCSLGNTIQNWTHCSSCPGNIISARTEHTVFLFVCLCPLSRERVYWAVAQKRPRRGLQKTPFFYCYVCVRCHGNVFTEPLPRNGGGEDYRKHRSSIVAFVFVATGTCLLSCCPETVAARTTENTVLLLLRACMLRALPSNGRCLQSNRLATGLYAKVLCWGLNLSDILLNQMHVIHIQIWMFERFLCNWWKWR